MGDYDLNLASIGKDKLKIKDLTTSIFKVPWFFDKWYEKIIMVLLFCLGLWQVVDLVILLASHTG